MVANYLICVDRMVFKFVMEELVKMQQRVNVHALLTPVQVSLTNDVGPLIYKILLKRISVIFFTEYHFIFILNRSDNN